MANFSNVNWSALFAVFAEVDAEVKALQAATDNAGREKAVGDLVMSAVSAIESFSGKDFVNDEALKGLVGDVIKGIADAQALKPVPSA